MEAKEILRLEYGDSKNLMTPHVVGRGYLGKYGGIEYAYELSKGTGINHNLIYGVSIASYNSHTKRTERHNKLSGCFQTREEAREYIKKLKKTIRKEELI